MSGAAAAGGFSEEVLSFACEGEALWGLLSAPAGAAAPSTAVLVVVGGPQYRVGSHRQFVLLARRLAAAGYPTLRFDYRGMGDAPGGPRTFEQAGPDVQAALDALWSRFPSLRRMVVWGLCDAASAALMHAAEDPRVGGIVAANPWARSEASLAAVHVKHYYAARLLERSFWAKALRGGLDVGASVRSLLANVKQARARAESPAPGGAAASFQDRMADGLRRLRGGLLLVLSGSDLTAQEFLQVAASSPRWSGLLDERRVSRCELPQADHTFSRREWSSAVEDATLAWLAGLDAPDSDFASTRNIA